MTYQIVRIDTRSTINLKGWKIVASNGDILMPFTTRAEAQRLIDFFGAEKVGFMNCKLCLDHYGDSTLCDEGKPMSSPHKKHDPDCERTTHPNSLHPCDCSIGI